MLVSVSDLTNYMDIRFSLRQQDAAEMVLEGLQSELESFLRRPVEVQEYTETYVIPASEQGYPSSSFFYDKSIDTTGHSMNYIQPSVVFPLRNSPVVQIKSVSVQNLALNKIYLAEAMHRDSVVTNITRSNNILTVTSLNDFTKGQHVTIKGVVPNDYNITVKEILSVTPTSFTVSANNVNIDAGPYVSGGVCLTAGTDYTTQRWGVELYCGFPNDLVEVNYIAGLDGEQIKVFKLMILRAATREMQNMHDDVVGVKDLNSRNVAPLETGFTEKELNALKRWRRRRI
jgi:hypothetical protein